MSWQAAKQVSDAWIKAHLVNDLKGRYVQLVAFQCDADCRFFYRDRDLGYHKMICTAIARTTRKRGGTLLYVEPTIDDYRAWLNGGRDTPEHRAKFIERHARLLS